MKSEAWQRMQARALKAQEDESAAATTTKARNPDLSLSRRHLESSERIAEKTRELVLIQEQLGLFDAALLNGSKNEYPSIMTRIPIFRASKPSTQRKQMMANEDGAMVFKSRYGTGRRFGPPLTISDEDTLIAAARLRHYRLSGQPGNMPIPVAPSLVPSSETTTTVHTVICTVGELNRVKGLGDGGINYRQTLASIKRLAATRIELSVRKHERYLGKVEKGTTFSIIDVAWTDFESDGVIAIQFSPIVSSWLENEYTYINWAIRQHLGDTGKGAHRYLSGQPMTHEIPTKELAEIIGYDCEFKQFRPELIRQMKKLEELNWLKEWEVTTGSRGKSGVLRTVRSQG